MQAQVRVLLAPVRVASVVRSLSNAQARPFGMTLEEKETGEGARLSTSVPQVPLPIDYFDWSTVMPCGLFAAFSALAFLAAMALSTHSSAVLRSAAR